MKVNLLTLNIPERAAVIATITRRLREKAAASENLADREAQLLVNMSSAFNAGSSMIIDERSRDYVHWVLVTAGVRGTWGGGDVLDREGA